MLLRKRTFLGFLMLVCSYHLSETTFLPCVNTTASDIDDTTELKAKVKLFLEIEPKHTYHFSGCHIPLSDGFLSG